VRSKIPLPRFSPRKRDGCKPSTRHSEGHSLIRKGPRGETRPADVIGNAVHAMRIATGEIEETTAESEGIGLWLGATEDVKGAAKSAEWRVIDTATGEAAMMASARILAHGVPTYRSN
jgi:hypothetical protein